MIIRYPWHALAAVGVLLLLTTLVIRAVRRAVRRVTEGSDGQTVLTVAVAGIATGVSANGMWNVFGDTLGMNVMGRLAGFAFIELALVVSALRARASLRATGSVGVDGVAVWVLAAGSGVVSALDQPGAVGKMIRLGAPLLAAWLWERGLAPDRRVARGGVVSPVAWRFTRHRVAVWLRLADPIERTAPEVDRARRLARLTRARLRLAVLESATSPQWVAWLAVRPVRVAVARWRLTRQTLAAVEHLALGQDARTTAAIRSTVAAVVGLPRATDPATLTATAATSSWSALPVARPHRQVSATPTSRVAGSSATVLPQVADVAAQGGGVVRHTDATGGGPVTDPEPPQETAVAGPVAVASAPVADMTLADQVAWFARHLPRHPRRTVPEWMAETGLAKRTVERRIAAAREVMAQPEPRQEEAQ